MPGTAEAVAAQQAAMALVHAIHQRDDWGEEVVYDVLRMANHEHHPVNIMVALASLVPTTVQIAERRTAEILADPTLLRALLDAAMAGCPISPGGLGLGVADVLAAAGAAANLNQPD